jgi:D-serine deaminase-like pyridoxal phosphate-dependent protein
MTYSNPDSSDFNAIPSTRDELVTPALLLDLDAFETNISTMAGYTRSVGIDLRPHAKTHKCPEIARRQIEAGAIGICVATIKEAEAMTNAGIPGLLLTSEMTSAPKISRLIRLLQEAPDLMVVVDNSDNANALSAAALEVSLELNVLLDVDPGIRRTGVSGVAAVALAAEIIDLGGLRLRGVHSYAGSSAHIPGWEARREHSLNAMQSAIETFERMKRLGMPAEILSGGSTGTYNIDTSIEHMTELQAGSYVFMDMDYRRIGGQGTEEYTDFQQSLTVLATVVSRNHDDRVTVDAGIKAFSMDRSFPPAPRETGLGTVRIGADEHGILELGEHGADLRIGDRIEFLPPHCDPTVNLYDRIYCVRGESVEAVWPIVGRH